MLYQLSYASRCKLTIILTGSHIARETANFFLGCLERPTPSFPAQIPTVCVRGLPSDLRWLSRHPNSRSEAPGKVTSTRKRCVPDGIGGNFL